MKNPWKILKAKYQNNLSRDDKISDPNEIKNNEPVILHGPLTEAESKENERREREKRDDDFKDRQITLLRGQLRSNNLIALFTLVLAILGGFGNYVAWRSAAASERSSDAAKSAADSARDGLTENRQSRIDSARDNWWSTFKSNALAIAAMDSSIESARNDQRAWVGVQQSSVVVFRQDTIAQIDVVIVNTGKTPALNYTMEMDLRTRLKKAPYDFTYETLNADTIKSVFVVNPLQGFKLPVKSRYPIPEENVQSVLNGNKIVYVFGRYTYMDVFGKRHGGTYCMFVDHDLQALDFCDLYNTAN